MGCAASTRTKPLAGQSVSSSSDNHRREMSMKSQPVTVVFKVMPSELEARKKFEKDGTLIKNSDAGHLALRTMLDEPLSQNSLGKFAAKIQVLDIFMCWIDIQEYKSIPTASYRRSKALHIYQKYIKEDAVLMIGSTTKQQREKVEEMLQESKSDPNILTPTFFDEIQSKCFLDMYHNIFLPFKQTDEFQQLTTMLKNKYNRVKVTDFEYYNKLGEGGFGFVVHCKKKSTGKHYAMKIQTKIGLLDCYKEDPHKVLMEKDAFASLQHPFIVNLYYAFQTPQLVVMVLDLADCGDLHGALVNAPNLRLPEDRVRFYVAEMILALGYLHQRGLIYRDLKPQNVLLNADGHVQLVDLGGIMDDQGTWTEKQQNEYRNILPLFSQGASEVTGRDPGVDPDDPANAPFVAGEESPAPPAGKKKKKKQSIMGTLGYMAPEMVLMLNRPPMYGEQKEKKVVTRELIRRGYTHAVDWWSLGVTMYKLLTGNRPFADKQMYAFVDLASTLHEAVGENMQFREYAMLFQKVSFPSYISPSAQHFMSQLLDVDDSSRLGAGPTGTLDIMKHPFFQGLDWDMLEQKQVEPPFIPPRNEASDMTPPAPDLRSLLAQHGKEMYMVDTPPDEKQKYFDNW